MSSRYGSGPLSLSDQLQFSSGSAEIHFRSHSKASMDVGAVEYVAFVEVSDGLLKWKGKGAWESVGDVGDVAVDVLALGGEYGCSYFDVPTGETSLFALDMLFARGTQ